MGLGHGTADSPDAGEQEGWNVLRGEMLKHGYKKKCLLALAWCGFWSSYWS
jgi:hypothetical protein